MQISQILPLFATFLLGTTSLAWAGEPDAIEGEPLTPQIYQGTPVQTCGWPTVVAVTSGGGLCTGTLVHPRVVVYAAHCGGGNKTIRFGENAFDGGNAIGASCQTNVGYSSEGDDWAYCVLNEAVTDLPIAPILYGCELDSLQPQAEVAVVGFGKNTGNGGSGTKRWGTTELQAVNLAGNTTIVGGSGTPSICPGDSGGPALIQDNDGIWRAFGIASTVMVVDGSDCGGTGTHSLIAGAVPWIEEQSGYDITPCHDVEGNWDPSPDCTGFFGSGPNTYGGWGNWCGGTPASPAPSTCGPSTGTLPETNPPAIAITSPADGYTSPEIPTMLDIEMDISDDTGYLTAWLRIDGEDFLNQTDSSAPWSINSVSFPEGVYEIRGVAEDYWGNQGVSEAVTVVIGEEPPPGGEEGDGDATGDPDTGGDSEGDTGSDTGFETSGGPADAGFDGGGLSESGCGCSSDAGSGAGGLAGLSLLLLGLGIRRRRED